MKYEDFDSELRHWSRRPGRLSPDEAASRVVAGVAPRQARLRPWAWAAVFVMILGASFWLYRAPEPPPYRIARITSSAELGPVVVMTLESGSHLYLQLPTPSTAKGDSP